MSNVLTLNERMKCVAHHLSRRVSGKEVRSGENEVSIQLSGGKQLHEYQARGVNWILRRMREGLPGCILGDEMGLGKTLQVGIFITTCQHEGLNPKAMVQALSVSFLNAGLTLVICPLSVTSQWLTAAEDFRAGLRICAYGGSPKERELVRKVCSSGLPSWKVLITSYEIALIDLTWLMAFELEERRRMLGLPPPGLLFRWSLLVVDEAHRLKNASSRLYKSLTDSRWDIGFRLLLTGTPIQNSMEELWALLRFCDGHGLSEARSSPRMKLPCWSSQLGKLLTTLDEEGNRNFLKTEVLPSLLLRRTVGECSSSSLPPLDEVLLRVPMADLQRKLYIWLITQNVEVLDTLGKKKAKFVEGAEDTRLSFKADSFFFSELKGATSRLRFLLQQLRLVADHPYLIPGVEAEPFEEGPHVWETSGKLTLLESLVPWLLQQGSSPLVFSSFTGMLDVLQDWCEYRNVPYERLDGSVRGMDRQLRVSRFQNTSSVQDGEGCGPQCVFLISTRAGSLGLNLTRASSVVFVDPDWNPHVERQALARAWRQGQTKSVKVFRLLSEHSVDETIFIRARKKLELSRGVLSGGPMQEEQPGDDVLRKVIVEGVSSIPGERDLNSLMEAEMPTGNQCGEASLNAALSDYMKGGINLLLESARINELEKMLQSRARPNTERKKPVSIEHALSRICIESARRAEVAGKEDQDFIVSLGKRKTMSCSSFLQGRRRKWREVEPAAEEPSEEEFPVRQVHKKPLLKAGEDNRTPAHNKDKERSNPRKKGTFGPFICEVPSTVPSSTFDVEVAESGGEKLGQVYHLKGDASEPTKGAFSVLTLCVDSSGVWPNRGVFRALAEKYPSDDLPSKYKKLKTLGALKKKAVFLYGLSESEESSKASQCGGKENEEPSSEAEQVEWPRGGPIVALCVCVSKRRLVNLEDMKECFTKLSCHLKRVNTKRARKEEAEETSTDVKEQRAGFSLHLPRHGEREGLWYAVERILKTYVSKEEVDSYVYYFQRS